MLLKQTIHYLSIATMFLEFAVICIEQVKAVYYQLEYTAKQIRVCIGNVCMRVWWRKWNVQRGSDRPQEHNSSASSTNVYCLSEHGQLPFLSLIEEQLPSESCKHFVFPFLSFPWLTLPKRHYGRGEGERKSVLRAMLSIVAGSHLASPSNHLPVSASRKWMCVLHNRLEKWASGCITFPVLSSPLPLCKYAQRGMP